MQEQRFYTLDAMRGVAAIIVVTFHAGTDLRALDLPYAYLAVDFFFVLSGFVIARTYQPRLLSGLSVMRFFKLRAIRLYPMFLMGAAIGAAFLFSQRAFDPIHAWHIHGLILATASNLMVLPDPMTFNIFPLNPPAWSLFFEFAVNIFFALVLVKLSTRALIIIVIFSGLMFGGGILDHGTAQFGIHWSNFGLGAVRCLFDFTLGILIARQFEPGKRKSSYRAALVVAVAGITLAMPIPGNNPAFVIGALFGILPILVVFGTRLELPIPLVPLGQILGDISYPLYALHVPLLFFFNVAFHRFGLPPLIAQTAFVCGATAIAWAVGLYIDVPIRSWLTKYNGASQRLSTPPQAETAP